MAMLSAEDLGLPTPAEGWPAWAMAAPYVGAAHPLVESLLTLIEGANCQRYAYSILALFGRWVPEVRSSELWSADLMHPDLDEAAPLDLALFNHSSIAWGAHVAVVTRLGLLHLCAEEGKPAMWAWGDFSSRHRYSRLVGLVRPGRHRYSDTRAAGEAPPCRSGSD